MLSINPKLLYVRNQKTGKFVPLLAIIGPKGPPGSIDNITDYLTNETGNSEELAISQQGFTALLTNLKTKLENTNTELTQVSSELKQLLDYLNIPYYYGTPGLEYSLDKTTNTCSITAIGTAENEKIIIIPDRIYNVPVTKIDNGAFSGSQFEQVELSNNVLTIGPYAFSGCTNLTKIDFKYNVTNIGIYAFSGCTSLEQITIPNSVKTIADFAFNNCNNLTSVTYNGTQDEWNSIVSTTGNNFLTNAEITFIGE